MTSSVPLEMVNACSSGDVQTLYQLLSQHPDPTSLINLASDGGVTLLMHAIIGAGILLSYKVANNGWIGSR